MQVGQELTQEEQQVWRAYSSASQLLFDRLDRELKANAGISATYYEILACLATAPRAALRMSELAERSLSSRSRLSHAIDRLEELGWVRREGCPQDGRGAYAVLTDAGREVLAQATPAWLDGLRAHFFDQLTEAQLIDLRAISEALVAHLQAAPGCQIEDPCPSGQGSCGED